jgi:hypothetical protein
MVFCDISRYAESHFFTVMLGVIILNVNMLNAIMLNAIMLNVIMHSVEAPKIC